MRPGNTAPHKVLEGGLWCPKGIQMVVAENDGMEVKISLQGVAPHFTTYTVLLRLPMMYSLPVSPFLLKVYLPCV